MSYTYSQAELLILKTIAEKEHIATEVAQATYTYYLRTGITPHKNAPQWMHNLWRESQEHKHLHQEPESTL